ncbi:MAG TPA: adenylate/guanylate cyclase domain-containing protein [Candidatus Limnocylindrales bacterium]|nr:adenylate/guanylate cyclase domain-containing protein [Candidatus Limnocylindrales bacterium]
MPCPNCGATNEPGRKFCGECGTRLARLCPNCGTASAQGVKFCGECGNQLEGDGQATEARPATLRAAPVTSQPTTERRLVSVLFADLVGFTARSDGRDPEQVRDFLGRYFEVARDVIERYGGTVEKFIGDAVMAVWGTPVALEDDAERAVRAGLDLVEAVHVLGRAAGDDGLDLRAAVLTGEAAATVGATGQGMVAGDLVNTASRLQSIAPSGTVLVGEATQRAASRAVLFEAAGDQLLKGKAAPVPAWRALRVVAERGGLGRSEGLEAPFVGRDAELRLMKDAYHATARERKARLVSITGQAGIGKSRLAWEFNKYMDGLKETVRWHSGRSPAYGEGVTFWALGEMVRRRAQLSETDDERTTRSRIAETLDVFVPDPAEQRRIGPALLFLLGIGDGPAGGREELFVAWRTFFERIAMTAPVMLVFEDLQWADTGLLDFIDYLLDWSKSFPILVVTLARPELLDRRPDWGAGRRNLIGISLEPLPEAAIRELLNGLVHGLPEAAVRSIVTRADGVPLYAVEIVRMLVAEGRLEEADGVYRIVGDLGDLHVPESLHALIAARLDTIDPTDRAILQDAAVLGQTFSLAALSSLTSEPVAALEDRFGILARREIVALDTDARSPERGQWGFTQALIREVAYSTLAKRDRRARHLAAARYFESLGDDELPGVLATHYLAAYEASPDGPEAAAVAVQARIALKAAAERAAALGAHEQAIRFLEQALEVATDPVEEAELLARAGEAASAAGRHDDAERLLRRALVIQRQRGDARGIAGVAARLGGAYLFGTRTEQAIALLEEVAAGVTELEDPESVELIAQLGRAYYLGEQFARGIAVVDRAMAAAERLDLVRVIADGLVTKGTGLSFLGRSYEGLGTLEAGRRLAEANGFDDTSLRGALNASNVQLFRDPSDALATARAGLEQATRLGRRGTAATVLGNAADAAQRTGDWDWAVAAVREALTAELDSADRLACLQSIIPILGYRGELGDELKEAEGLVVSDSDIQNTAAVARAHAAVAFAEGRFEAARRAHLKTFETSSSTGPLPLALAARAALWQRDAAGLRDALARFEAFAAHGPALEVDRRTMRAGLAGLEGRRADALALYREAWQGWRDLGCRFDLALTELDAIFLLGIDEPELEAAVAEARTILLELRAAPFLARLDLVLAEAPVGLEAPSHGQHGGSRGADSVAQRSAS